jgi:hypothetical protein
LKGVTVQKRRRKPNRDLQEEVIWAEALAALAQAASTAAMERRRRLTRADNSPAEYARVERRWDQAAQERNRQNARLRELRKKAGIADDPPEPEY